jgi:hypothetical protein
MNVKWTVPKDLINDVILSTLPGAGDPALPTGGRAEAEAWLTRVLVDWDAFAEHVSYLRRQFRVPDLTTPRDGTPADPVRLARPLYLGFPFHRLLPKDDAFRIEKGGLAVASDAALAELLVNPAALDLLRALIEDTEAGVWQTAQAEFGRELFGGELAPRVRELIEERPAEESHLVGRLNGGSPPPTQPGPAAPHWRFRRSGNELGWPGEPDARMVAIWDGAIGQLSIRVSGMLVLAPGCRVEVEWLRQDGLELGRDGVSDAMRVLRICPKDALPPVPTDRFRLRYTRRLDRDPEQSVTWEDAFGDPAA